MQRRILMSLAARVALAVMLAYVGVASAATGNIAPVGKHQFFDDSGRPLASGKLYTYTTGTSSPLPTYSDSALTTPNANPTILDGAGRTVLYLDPSKTYKFVLKTSADVTIWSVDPIIPVNQFANTDVTITAGEALTQNQSVFISDGSNGRTAGRAYLTDADDATMSVGPVIVGIVIDTSIASAATGTMRLRGRLTGFSSLSPGSTYYLSQTAGAITSTAPANQRRVGTADTPTTLLLEPGVIGGTDTVTVLGTVGVTVAAGDVLYLSDGSGGKTAGQWFEATNANDYSSSMAPGVGVAFAGITSGQIGAIQIDGLVSNLSGLTAGTSYFIGSTAGSVTATAPGHYVRRVGVAPSTTTMLLQPDLVKRRVSTGQRTVNYTAVVGDDVIEMSSTSATTVSLYAASGNAGRELVVKNENSGVVTVAPAGADTINGAASATITLLQNEAVRILVVSTTDWQIVSDFRRSLPVTSVVNTYTAAITDATIEANKSSAFTITLYAASANIRRVLTVKNIGAGAVTVAAAGADTIDGGTALVLQQNGIVTIQVTASTTWRVLSRAAEIQTFTANGTWTKEPGAKTVRVLVIGAGGGGGSGRRGAAGGVRAGGSGGGGAAVTLGFFDASLLGSTESVTVGTGGTAGAAVTANDTNGNAAGNGGSSSFGSWLVAGGGGGGLGGTNGGEKGGGGGGSVGSASGSTGGSPAVAYTVNGIGGQGAGGTDPSVTTGNAEWGGGAGAGIGSAATGQDGRSSIYAAGGGGSGGGIDNTDAVTSPGAGGTSQSYASGGGGANGTSGATGTVGTAGSANSTTKKAYGGDGGGGGGSSTGAAAAAGGAGGIPGGAAGGGGASVNGNNSGIGGVGARGQVVVITFF